MKGATNIIPLRSSQFALVYTMVLLLFYGVRSTAQDFYFYNGTNVIHTLVLEDVIGGGNFVFNVTPGYTELEGLTASWYTFSLPLIPEVANGTMPFYLDCTFLPIGGFEVVNNRMLSYDEHRLGYSPCSNIMILNSTPQLLPPLQVDTTQPPSHVSLLLAPSFTQNYLVESVLRRSGVMGASQLEGVAVDSANRTIQYFDGLGRLMQTVQWQGSPDKKDIVQHMEYDGFGRESIKYLPYAELVGSDGSYKANAKASQSNFYKVGGGWDASVVKTPCPYAVTVFENSPLTRVQQQGSPGTAWHPASSRTTTGRTVVTDYGTNTATGHDAVKLWKPTYDASGNPTGATGATNYLAGKLYKTVVKDENWTSGKTGTVEEYKDFEDRVVLKRVWESESKRLDTYYIYDDFGDLRYVVPPVVTVSSFTTQPSDANFEHYIYGYNYDGRRRLIEKKIPGKGWEHFVYNKNDQLIQHQDAVQRDSTQWLVTKYDAFGRVVMTGIHQGQSDRATEQSHVDNNETVLWETRLVGAPGYGNVSYPQSNFSLRTVHYYDDYTFQDAGLFPASGVSASSRTRTLLTGSLVYKDDGSAPLLTVNYYDDRARLIQSVSQNHLGGTDVVTNNYSFVGELLSSTRVHTAYDQTTTTVTTNEYDHVGRLVATKHYIDNPSKEVTLAKNEYNEIGQLKSKAVGGDASGGNPATTISYAYNERGWATAANSDRFSYELKYNVPVQGAAAQYNGNISEQHWHRAGDSPVSKTFLYSYDPLNRLKDGNSVDGNMREQITYDDMGNITNLKRDNHGTGTTYAYIGNRLKRLTGAIDMTTDYTYDSNGNAETDYMGMNFRYNHLNLPDTAWNSSVRVGYLYDAQGKKLRKYSNQGGNRDYVDGIEYKADGTIDFIHNGEGLAVRNESNNTYSYRYNITDHLGNVRATIYRNPTTNAVESLQKDDYYPFGKQHVVLGDNNKYLYNGKEKQDELGGQYDYGARFYDAEIGRWNVVDPLAEQMRRYSPYVYGNNNPIRFIDPDGMLSKDFLRELWNKSENGSKWTNQGDGSFSDGNDQIVKEQDPPLKSMRISQGGEKVYSNINDPIERVFRWFVPREYKDPNTGRTLEVDNDGYTIGPLLTGTPNLMGGFGPGGLKYLNYQASALKGLISTEKGAQSAEKIASIAERMKANDPMIYARPIYTYAYKGKTYILDGHNRIGAAIQNNQTVSAIELNTKQAMELFKHKVQDIHKGLFK